MLEIHVIHQHRGFGGCSIEIFTLENWMIVIFRVIGHVNRKTHKRELKYARDNRREIHIRVFPCCNVGVR